MRKKTLLIMVYAFVIAVGCATDTDDSVNIQSEHTGEESMIIKSKLDIMITALGGTPEDYPFLQGEVGAFYGVTYTGYVAPDYGNGNTSVTATLVSSSKTGYISYNDEQYDIGDSFSVLEFFNDSHSVPTSDFYYVGTEGGLHDVEILFSSNRGTTITTSDSFFFN